MTKTRPTPSDLALEKLRALLDDNAGRKAWRLPPERALAIQISAGRRALRRALDILEAEGRLWRHQGKGTFAGRRADASPELLPSVEQRATPLDVMEARLEIEPGLARLAAAKGSPAAIASMRRYMRTLAASEDADAMERWDGALHRVIAETAGNALLVSLFDTLDRFRASPSWRRPRALARGPERLRVTQAQHAAIIDAIAAHDGPAAENAMRAHLLTLQSNLRRAME